MKRREAASSLVSITSAPFSSDTEVPRTNRLQSPIQAITSLSRSRPVARLQLLLEHVAAAGDAPNVSTK